MNKSLLLFLVLASCGEQRPAPVDENDARAKAPADYQLPETGELNLIQLANFAKMERDFVKPDEFSKNFDDTPLIGRAFSLSLSLPAHSGYSSNAAEWAYDADKQRLHLTAKSGEHLTSYRPFLVIQTTTDIGETKKMTNAFGAEVDVSQLDMWRIELGTDYDTAFGVFPHSEDGFSLDSHDDLSTVIEIEADEARALVKQIKLEVSGTVTADKNGQSVNCYVDRNSATVNSPIESTTDHCVINAKLSRVAFVDGRGEIIDEWQ